MLLVTGVPAAGKSTVARKLSDWGHTSISLDDDNSTCSWPYPDGLQDPQPDHRNNSSSPLPLQRTWNPDRLDEIISTARRGGVQTLWLCGQSANASELRDRFDACLLLEIDQTTMRRRLNDIEPSDGVCRADASLISAIASYQGFVATWRRLGAVPVDGAQDPDQVCQDLLMTAALATLGRHR
ncbi:hypothetical protein [Micromonospora sp. Llam0]|uniref:hypothetical protein n=1 Tax=Micromonospora sp. Llam0 TaxID=2485143 RepID=UPI0011CDB296|nr:hypothetical protein [Micromonospora sp. Llam0]